MRVLIRLGAMIGIAVLLCAFLFYPIYTYFTYIDRSPRYMVIQWTTLYGKDEASTIKAALLTTDRFRHGLAPTIWGERVYRGLSAIRYQHMGGIVERETINNDTAVVIFEATISAVDGVTIQKEIYTLKRTADQWLIDQLEICCETRPSGVSMHRRNAI